MKPPRTFLVVAGFALALLGFVTWAEWRDATRAPALADQMAHTREVQSSVSELLSRVEAIEDGARGFVLIGEPAFLEPFSTALHTANSQFQVVRTLTRDNPNQQARCDVLERLIAQLEAVAQTTVNLRRESGFEAARQLVARGKSTAVMDEIRAEVAQMHAEEQTLLGQRRAAARDQRRRARAWAAAGSSLSVLLLGAAFALVWRENRLRRQAEQRLRDFNDQLAQRVRERTADLAHASRASREADERFRIMVEGVADYAILMLDPGGHVISWNPGAARLKGYREEEIVGQHFSRFYPEEDVVRGKPAMELEQAAANGRIADDGWRVRQDGTRFWASVIITALRDEAGRLRGFVKVTRDMTERKAADDALRTSERFLAQSQQLAHLGNWMVDLETGTVTWSEELYRIYGVSPDAFVPTVEAFLALVHPEDRSAMRSQHDAMRSGKKPRPIQFRVVRPDGTIRVIEGDGEIQVNAENKPTALVGTAQDITERRRTADDLRRSHDLLDHTGRMAKVGGWELDLETHTLRGTAELYRMCEVDHTFQPSVSTVTQLVAPEARPVVTAAVQAGIDAGTSFDLELPLITGQGRRLWVRAQGVAERRDGKTIRLCGALQDMTERVQLEAQFRQAQKMESVGRLASGIAHDFNNLLTVINGVSDLLLAQVAPDDPVHADVQEIHRAGERAAALTRQLLAFSRRQILEPRVVSLNALVAGLERLLRHLLGEDIALGVVLTPGGSYVKADPGQLEQVITNLAVNARDAMPQGGQLTLETRTVTLDEDAVRQSGVAVPPGSYVQLVVSDSGVGMDEATRARIFEPFFTTKGPGQGTGLGLSTVYGIVQQSQGCIGVESAVGRGTRVTMLLPQVTAGAGAGDAAPTATAGSGTETILLVEDNAGLRKLAARCLAPAGYTVLQAATGEEALRLVARREAPVHLLLSDVVMPGMSGRHLAEQLAQTRPGTKVLYMSGYTDDTIVRHGVLNAQVPFLNKPFTAAALLRKVREVLDS